MLAKYIQDKQTALFEKHGVFFAFGDAQFKERAKPGVEYVTVMSAGDCVPKENAEAFVEELSALHREGRKELVAEHGIDKIIRYELSNHECTYTGDITDAVEVLAPYGVTREQVLAVYHTMCRENNE